MYYFPLLFWYSSRKPGAQIGQKTGHEFPVTNHKDQLPAGAATSPSSEPTSPFTPWLPPSQQPLCRPSDLQRLVRIIPEICKTQITFTPPPPSEFQTSTHHFQGTYDELAPVYHSPHQGTALDRNLRININAKSPPSVQPDVHTSNNSEESCELQPSRACDSLKCWRSHDRNQWPWMTTWAVSHVSWWGHPANPAASTWRDSPEAHLGRGCVRTFAPLGAQDYMPSSPGSLNVSFFEYIQTGPPGTEYCHLSCVSPRRRIVPAVSWLLRPHVHLGLNALLPPWDKVPVQIPIN